MKRFFFLFIFFFGSCQNSVSPSKSSSDFSENSLESSLKSSLESKSTTKPTQALPLEFLEIEKKAGFSVPDSLFKEIEAFLQSFPSLPDSSTFDLRIEKTTLLKEFGERLQAKSAQIATYDFLLSSSWQMRWLDCDILSLFYVEWAKKNDLPLAGFLTNEHVFIAWTDAQDTIFWETTKNIERPMTYYQQRYQISAENTGKGRLLLPITPDDWRALAHFNVASKLLTKVQVDAALRSAFLALEFSPEWCRIYTLLGQIYWQKRDFNNAEIAFDFALELQPSNPLSQELKENMFRQIGCL